MPNPKDTENFIQEYLYIEDYPMTSQMKRDEDEKDDEDRGVIIISLFDTEEST